MMYTILRTGLVEFPIKRLQRLGREFFWVGLGQTAAVLGGIVGVRLLTYALPPVAYGELALGMTVAMLAQQAVFSPVSGASLRFFAPALEGNRLWPYLHGVKTLSMQAATLLLAVAGVLSLGLWTAGQANWLGLTVAAFLFALFSGYSGILDGMQNAARQRVIVAWHDGLAQWLRFLTAVGLVSLLGAFSQVAMLGYALASAVVLGSQYWFFHRRISTLSSSHSPATPNEVQDCVKQMRAYSWPFATWGLFTWAYMASDRWALQVFDTTSAVGLYAVLRQLGYYPIILLSGLIMQLITPMFFSQAGDGSDPARLQHGRKLNNMLVLGALLLTLLGTLLTFLLHSQIFLLLAAPEYREVSGFLPWMVLSGGLFAAGQLSVLSILSGTNTQHLIMPKIVTALLGVGLNFVGAYLLSVKGVVFANLTFSLSYFVWVSFLGNLSFRADQLASSG